MRLVSAPALLPAAVNCNTALIAWILVLTHDLSCGPQPAHHSAALPLGLSVVAASEVQTAVVSLLHSRGAVQSLPLRRAVRRGYVTGASCGGRTRVQSLRGIDPNL